MSRYIVWVRQGNCVKRGNDWYQDTWYDYEPEEYHEYSSYGEAYNMFTEIDLEKYHLSNERKFLFKEVVEPEYDKDGEITGWQAIDYKERFFKDWIDG